MLQRAIYEEELFTSLLAFETTSTSFSKERIMFETKRKLTSQGSQARRSNLNRVWQRQEKQEKTITTTKQIKTFLLRLIYENTFTAQNAA